MARVIEGTVVEVKRMTNSINGNPQWRVHLDTGMTKSTRKDSTVGYEIDQSWSGAAVSLELDGREQIIGARRRAR